MRIVIAFFIFSVYLVACGQSNKTKQLVNPEAKKLSDSAMLVFLKSFKEEDYERSILLLEKATKIDSNYFKAYYNRMLIENTFKHYDKALIAANRITRLKPDDPGFYITAGILYEKNGNPSSSKEYFQTALVKYNSILDTMQLNNPGLFFLKMNKGVDLILLNQQEQGNTILKDLYAKETAGIYKEALTPFLNKSR
jgi:tetratricopeptide (TPR) repeat protein